MSTVGHKRKTRDESPDASPETKKRKIDNISIISTAVSQMYACSNWGYRVYMRKFRKTGKYSAKQFIDCCSLLSQIPIDQQKEIIKTVTGHSQCTAKGRRQRCCKFYAELGAVMTGKSYAMVRRRFSFCKQSILSEKNRMKLKIIRNISKATGHIPAILTITLNNKKSNKNSENTDKSYKIEYYQGTIDTLDDFTAKLFKKSVKDFEFFRFIKKTINSNGKCEYIECNDKEVLRLLHKLKSDKSDASQTFLLLTFFMVAYFKNFLFNSVKNAVQIASEMDKDTLSCIMSFMMTNHSSFNDFFEDTQLIKALMSEASKASRDWQDLLVEIIQNDDDYKKIYQPKIRKYHTSEKLNLLNMEFYGKPFGQSWLKKSVENNHHLLFRKLLDEHCDDRIMRALNKIYKEIDDNNLKVGDEWRRIITEEYGKH